MLEHDKESLCSPDSEKLKLKTIADIKDAGFEVEKIIINSNLTEEEAFVAEAKDRLPRQDIILTPKTENRLFFEN